MLRAFSPFAPLAQPGVGLRKFTEGGSVDPLPQSDASSAVNSVKCYAWTSIETITC